MLKLYTEVISRKIVHEQVVKADVAAKIIKYAVIVPRKVKEHYYTWYINPILCQLFMLYVLEFQNTKSFYKLYYYK